MMNKEKDYCCSNIQYLSRSDFIEIGSILIDYDLKYLIKECNNGCLVDLNKIEDELIIHKIFNLIKKKILNLEYK